MHSHDLAQQENYLRAALEQEKKPVGFLIGAGAPMSMRNGGDPLIPGLEALTKLVMKEAHDDYKDGLLELVSHLDLKDQDNLEAILNYVRALKALPGSSDIRGISVKTLEGLDADITGTIRKHVNAELPPGDTPYTSLALWISAVRRLSATQVFTTNYDLLIEQALERRQVAYFDGFMGAREPSFDLQAVEEDQLPSRWTQLWKLHGSINWSQDAQGNVVRKALHPSDTSSALVYPSHLKYDQSRRLPYLAMMDRLKAFMRKPGAVLITTGFSFRDQHINEVLNQAMRANQTASVQGLLFGELEGYVEARALALELPNLVLIARDAGVVGTVQGTWTPSTNSDGEQEDSKCHLGDFSQFGRLLRTMTGQKEEEY